MRLGGFTYIPGSHHAIQGGQYATQLSVWKEALDTDVATTLDLEPGDLYVFSEALVHGQRTWRGNLRKREVLYIKYVPGYMAWQSYEVTKNYLQYATSPIHEALLSPPFARVGDYTSNIFRPSIHRMQFI